MSALINNTPFWADSFPSTNETGISGTVVLVKGTWQLQPTADATPRLCEMQHQLPIYPDGLHQTLGSLELEDVQRQALEARDSQRLKQRWARFETDYTRPKNHFDILINAWATSPDGQPKEFIEVAVDYTTEHSTNTLIRLLAHAPRYWKGVSLLNQGRAEVIAPVQRIPLFRPFAFGGQAFKDNKPNATAQAYPANPDGMGYCLQGKEAKEALLPWIESPEQAIQSWQDTPIPVALGHLPPHHSPRRERQGTFDAAWKKSRAPKLPTDFDPRHHNAAPDALQLTRSPRPGHVLSLRNMGAHPVLYFVWPAINLSAHAEGRGGTRIPAQELRWDSLQIEAQTGQAALVWRAVFNHSADQAPQHITLSAQATPLSQHP